MKRSEEHDAAGLTGAERTKLKLDLERARFVALGELAKAEAHARVSESEAEPMDAVELASEQGNGALFVARTRAHLRDVEDALAKIASGGYGLSERSGRPIGYDRLAAVPWTRTAADEE
jgi:DnaK suppressor protein